MRKISVSLILLLAVGSVILQGCDPCSDTGDQLFSRTSVFLRIEGANGESLLDSIKGPYFPDSVKAFTKEASTLLLRRADPWWETDDILFELYPPLNSTLKSTIYLQLNQADTDTLDIHYELITHKCGTYYQFTDYRLNGKTLELSLPYGILNVRK